MGWLADIFSGLFQGFLSLFGASDAQKLGRAETENTALKTELKEVQDAHTIDSRVAGMSDADVDKLLRQNGWEK